MNYKKISVILVLGIFLGIGMVAKGEEIQEEVKSIRVQVRGNLEESILYSSVPEITVWKKKGEGNLRYKIQREEEILAEGDLREEETKIFSHKFQEGKQEVIIWKEGEEEEIWKKNIFKDTKPPQLVFAPQLDFQKKYQEVPKIGVRLLDEDGGSGGKQLVGYQNGEKIAEGEEEIWIQGRREKGEEKIDVTILGFDKAGNEAKQEISIFLLPESFQKTEESGTENTGKIEKKQEENQEKKEGGKEGSSLGKKENQWIEEKEEQGKRKQEGKEDRRDEEGPKIQGIQQISKKAWKEFVLEKEGEKWISDANRFQYEIRVDGRLYGRGEKLQEEGIHHLEVRAKDVLGNESRGVAKFLIDRTKPKIFFRGVKDGESYGKRIRYKIETKKKDEQLIGVWINGRKQPLKNGKFQDSIQKKGRYKIEAEAIDKAGNRTKQRVEVRRVSFATLKWKQGLESIKKFFQSARKWMEIKRW